jgi:acyl-CoA thioesterase FadM
VGEYQARGILMALSELSIKYKTPLRSGDVFRVDTSVEQVGWQETAGSLLTLWS